MVEQVFGLHNNSLGVVKLVVGLQYGSPKVVKLVVGLHCIQIVKKVCPTMVKLMMEI